jgi:hypothetical protein
MVRAFRRGGPISKHTSGLGARNQEWMCWRRSATNYCLALYHVVRRESYVSEEHRLHLQGWKAKRESGGRWQAVLSLPPVSAEFLIGLLFDLGDGYDMFLRNVVLSPNYTPFQTHIYKPDAPIQSSSSGIPAKLFRKSSRFFKGSKYLEIKICINYSALCKWWDFHRGDY